VEVDVALMNILTVTARAKKHRFNKPISRLAGMCVPGPGASKDGEQKRIASMHNSQN
jgi:hypothetical protein